MYDLREIKTIPCKDVAQKYGINQLERKGNKLWGRLRFGDKTPSFNIDISKNIWYDFGIAKGGSNIDLVMEITGCDKNDAVNQLAHEFGIQHQDMETSKWRPLTDNQYRELGIQPERATMNFNYDLSKHTPEQLTMWNDKYAMPVSMLAERYPTIYNKLIEKFAMESINALRDIYHSQLKMYKDPSLDDLNKSFVRGNLKNTMKDINDRVDLFQRAVTTVKSNYNFLKVDLDRDLKQEVKAQNKNQQNQIKNKELKNDEIIKNRIVNVYKKVFNYDLVERFTVDQAKALKDINKIVTKSENKFISIDRIKRGYAKLGLDLEKIEKDYKNSLKDMKELSKNKDSPEYKKVETKVKNLENTFSTIKDLFNKTSLVIEGIRTANILNKNEIIKQNMPERNMTKNVELSQ